LQDRLGYLQPLAQPVMQILQVQPQQQLRCFPALPNQSTVGFQKR
jgi:hypothetical protein